MELDRFARQQPGLLGQQVNRVLRRGLVAVAALPLVLAAAHAQTFYKWKDASGATHYSDTPPPKGNAAKLKVRGSVEAQSAPEPAQASSARPAAGPSPELREAEARYQEQSCAAARRDVASVQGGKMLVNSSDPTQAKRLDASQRQDALAAAQDRVKQFCGAGSGKP